MGKILDQNFKNEISGQKTTLKFTTPKFLIFGAEICDKVAGLKSIHSPTTPRPKPS